MAHIVFMTRGILDDVNKFITQLSCKFLPFKYKGEDRTIQVRVCPVQLWDVSFPKEHEEAMKNTLFAGGNVESMTPKVRKFVAVLRKMLGLKKMKNFEHTDRMLAMTPPQNMDIFAIGSKEDRIVKEEDGEYEGI